MIPTLVPGTGRTRFPITDVVPAADLPRLGHLCSLAVIGWSMFPTIRQGDVLTIEPARSIQTGDIVVFPFSGTLVCHRVIGIERGGRVRTQGDAVATADPPVRMQEIVGKVVLIQRGGRAFELSSAPRPSLASVARKQLEVMWMTCRARLAHRMLTVSAALTRRALVKQLAGTLLTRCVRYELGLRAPLRSLSAYRFVPLSGFDREGTNLWKAPFGLARADDVVLQARLGRRCLARWHPASDSLHVSRVTAAFGLAAPLRTALQAAYRRLLSSQSALANDRPAPPSPTTP